MCCFSFRCSAENTKFVCAFSVYLHRIRSFEFQILAAPCGFVADVLILRFFLYSVFSLLLNKLLLMKTCRHARFVIPRDNAIRIFPSSDRQPFLVSFPPQFQRLLLVSLRLAMRLLWNTFECVFSLLLNDRFASVSTWCWPFERLYLSHLLFAHLKAINA